MTSTGPWWAAPLIAVIGTVSGVVLTLLVSGRRENRSRFGEQRRTVYAEFLSACDELARVVVWPTPRVAQAVDTTAVVERIRAAAMHTVLVAHGTVTKRLTAVLAAAEALAGTIEQIRATGKPGHQGAVDEHHRPRHTEASTAFFAALNEFAKAARADIDVRTPFEPVFPIAG
ncbi:hypothetical protein [Actinokineospora diospyrosa]|uniref:LemA protein n=1 Tax=Actinokineospora diospyrosa TaxID=103728 RepID=A0ABT1IBP7_9PSEU|nr:hypothetical protein [Actinokineospora diospyrosa]MCP2270057.1 hypothetical protein [Actinokineospora diospyrosa]